MNKDIIKSMDWIMDYAHNNDEKLGTIQMGLVSIGKFKGEFKSNKALEILEYYQYLECQNCNFKMTEIGHTYKATPKGYTYETWEKEQEKLREPLTIALENNRIANKNNKIAIWAIWVLVVVEVFKMTVEYELCQWVIDLFR